MLVPYGGLHDISLQAGETVIVTPATGPFGGAAVLIALTMAVKLVAMGRNTEYHGRSSISVSRPERVRTVPIERIGIEADFEGLKRHVEMRPMPTST